MTLIYLYIDGTFMYLSYRGSVITVVIVCLQLHVPSDGSLNGAHSEASSNVRKVRATVVSGEIRCSALLYMSFVLCLFLKQSMTVHRTEKIRKKMVFYIH